MKEPPLHKYRHIITNEMRHVPVRTGDIIFRLGNESKYGLPFSKLVAKLTNSRFSHASLILVEDNNIYCLEENEGGTQLLLLQDWIDLSSENGIEVWRVNYLSRKDLIELKKEIHKFVAADPDYDITFTDPNKFYCTESVVRLYKKIGVDICNPASVDEVLSGFNLFLFYFFNNLFKIFTGLSIPNDQLYFVGNEKQGIMSSKRLYKIYQYAKN
jgi:hypothetical protein